MLMNVLRKSLHEVVIPEIKLVRAENAQIKTTLEITNKRLDDLNAHFADRAAGSTPPTSASIQCMLT